MHRMMLFLVFFLAFNAYGQQKLIAIINTVDDDEPPIKDSDLNHLTDRLRAIANKTLPQRNYAVMTQQSILSLFATPGDMMSKCNELEGCLVKIGREIAADYICQGRIGRFDGNLTIKVELYESISGNLVSSFAEGSKNISGLLSILDEKAPDMFRRMLGVFGSPSIVRGISDLERAVDYLLDFEKHYLVNLTTDPAGASLSFNGLPSSSCAQSPCKVELPDGKVRIIAALEQYEIADTTVSLVRNNQSVSIKLKPNFGVLEIKPAYSDGLGRNEQWNLTINDKTVSSMENRLLPNKYKVKLSHRCYEDINFEVGINKGSREVFNMDKRINLKLGGVVLSTERDGEPSSEPVFVNGKHVGETPFSGSVALCADVKLGQEKVSANIRLRHNETVRHLQKMPDTKEILPAISQQVYQPKPTSSQQQAYQAPPTSASKSIAFLILPSIQFGWHFYRYDNNPDTSEVTIATDFAISSIMAVQMKSFIIGAGINYGSTYFIPEIYLADREGKEADGKARIYPKYASYFAYLHVGSLLYFSGSFGKTFWTSSAEKYGIELGFADYFWETSLGMGVTTGKVGFSFECYYGRYEITVRDVLYGKEKDFWQGTIGIRLGLPLFGLE